MYKKKRFRKNRKVVYIFGFFMLQNNPPLATYFSNKYNFSIECIFLSEVGPKAELFSSLGNYVGKEKKWIKKKVRWRPADDSDKFCTPLFFLLQILRKVSFFWRKSQESFINVDTGPSDVRLIFGNSFLRKIHTLLRFFIKSFWFFPLWTNLQKIKDFLTILLQFFYRRKKVEFFYEKTSIEMCVFLRKFLPNISLTSFRPEYPCSSYLKRYVRQQNLLNNN